MGNDGGSIPDRRDLVRSKPKAEQADKHNQLVVRWFFCALSKALLQEPVVSCPLGKLYNKDAILGYLLDKSAYGDGEEICGHIRSLKDITTLKLTRNHIYSDDASDSERHAQFACPLTLKEMNGGQPFVYLATCGCTFSQAGLRALSIGFDSSKSNITKVSAESDEKEKDICPQCSTKFSRLRDIVTLNPGQEEELHMRTVMENQRIEQAAFKPKKSKKRKADETTSEPQAKRLALDGTAKSAEPYTNNLVATSRTVADALAFEEKKRKAIMTDAIKSLYTPKNKANQKETFMTRGTFTRYA